MSDPIQRFGDTARRLARNPLGIIALFIVLVYGIASLVTISTGAGAVNERQPLIYFLVFFPVLVLAVFAWLVSKHSDKLYGPSDFTNEENYMKLVTAASLGAATGKRQSPATDTDVRKIAESVQYFFSQHDRAAPPTAEIGYCGWTIGPRITLSSKKHSKQ